MGIILLAEAIRLVRLGQAGLIVKGLVETALVMGRLVRKENGLCRDGVLNAGHHQKVGIPSHRASESLDLCRLPYHSQIIGDRPLQDTAGEFSPLSGFLQPGCVHRLRPPLLWAG